MAQPAAIPDREGKHSRSRPSIVSSPEDPKFEREMEALMSDGLRQPSRSISGGRLSSVVRRLEAQGPQHGADTAKFESAREEEFTTGRQHLASFDELEAGTAGPAYTVTFNTGEIPLEQTPLDINLAGSDFYPTPSVSRRPSMHYDESGAACCMTFWVNVTCNVFVTNQLLEH